MIGVFSFSAVPLGVALTLASNGVYTLAGVALLAAMFNRERIIFAR